MRALLLALLALPLNAATICIGPSATGSGNGSDWNNQDDWATMVLTRGNKYYLADGSYAGKTFNTAASGTTWIEIYKAVVGDATVEAIAGWTSTLGDGQASFSGTIIFNTSNWIFDGVKGTGFSTGIPDKTSANYGFISTAANRVFEYFNTSIAISNITTRHTARIFSTSDIEKFFNATDNATRAVNFVTNTHCLSQNHGNYHWLTSPADDHRGWLFAYNVVLDVFSSAANHGEDFNNNFGTLVEFHYKGNWVEGTQADTPTMIMGALNNDSGPLWVYGNVFKNKNFTDGGICAVLNGQGTHTLTGGVFNNTWIGIVPDFNGDLIGGAGNNNMSAQNNLFVDSEVREGISGTYSHNAYRNCTPVPGGESNAQTLSSDPFVNAAGNDYRLSTNTSAGATTSFTTDPLGNAYNTSGTWSRGAFAFIDVQGGEGVSNHYRNKGKSVVKGFGPVF